MSDTPTPVLREIEARTAGSDWTPIANLPSPDPVEVTWRPAAGGTVLYRHRTLYSDGTHSEWRPGT